ncbi:MAG: hypothetical protein ACI923_001610 [Flavobacteriales bacterium]|jgi:hypothetical protein
MANSTITRQDFLDEINDFSEKLGILSKWKTSGDAFGHLTQSIKGKSVVANIAKPDYFYEFYCYIKILEDLQQEYKVEFEEGDKMFPRKPANKKGKPFFKLLKDGKEVFHVCAGTKILSIAGHQQEAPDISFQKPNAHPENPTYADVDIIMDPKYSESGEISAPKGAFNNFAMMVKHLQTENADNVKIDFTNFHEFKGNLLITNRECYTQDLAVLKINSVNVVKNFNETKTFEFLEGK